MSKSLQSRKIDKNLIAPCGMDCGICRAYLREKNKCPGCKKGPTFISCQKCKMKDCSERKGEFCFDCDKFPCDRLKHLDKRYREKYGMSEIENLENIRDNGIDEFIKSECKKYQSEKGVLCIHNKEYYS